MKTTERYDRFWADYFGIAPSDWNRPGISVQGHVGLKGYQGVWFFRRLDRTVVSAPDAWLPRINSHLADMPGANLMEESFIQGLFAGAMERIIGPVFQGFLSPAQFRPVHTCEVQSVNEQDTELVKAFRGECGQDWDYSGLEEANQYLTAAFEGSRIVSMAGYRAWEAEAGDPCVLTHPSHRGRGYAAAVTSAVVERALEHGKMLLYQTLEANAGAIHVARRLGYEQYARHFAVRLNA
jgi:GNAT superfamily N-acetyltransferase